MIDNKERNPWHRKVLLETDIHRGRCSRFGCDGRNGQLPDRVVGGRPVTVVVLHRSLSKEEADWGKKKKDSEALTLTLAPN